MQPVVFGLTGLGGYAGACCTNLLAAHLDSDVPATFAAVCEPDHETHAERIEELRAHGITVLKSLDELLDEPIEAVWLPLPIPLHRPFTEQALAAGKAVLCEKPAAGCVDDVDAMIAARDAAGLPVAIGFQDMYAPTTRALKQMLTSGAIGEVESATLWVCWPRTDQYFGRSNWAGRIKVNGDWVLDSPANNAMAHYLNLALFFLGSEVDASANPTAIEAELYRVNAIENYDTLSARITLEGGATLLVHMTHATEPLVHPTIELKGSAGRALWERQHITVTDKQGETTRLRRIDALHTQMLSRFASLVRGEDDFSSCIATLENARAQTVAICGASQAAPVYTVSEEHVTVHETEFGKLRAVDGIDQVFKHCTHEGQMLHESGLLPFTKSPRSLDLTGYNHFAAPATAD